MTPREKAIELVDKFSSALMHDEVYEDSIKCALIAVETVQNLCWGNNKVGPAHWQQVKQEIEKL